MKVNQAGSSPPPSGAPPKAWISQPPVVISGADLDDEHDRVADLDARVELGQARHERLAQHRAAEQPPSWPFIEALLVVERQVELEHVHARLAEHAERAVVCVLLDQLAHALERQPAHLGDPARLDLGVVLRDVRVHAGGRGLHRVGRHVALGEARVVRALALEVRGQVLLEQVPQVLRVRTQVVEEGGGRVVAGDRGPRLEVARVGSRSCRRSSFSCRGPTGLRKSWPIRREPTTLPSRSIWLPSALLGTDTCATPVVASG